MANWNPKELAEEAIIRLSDGISVCDGTDVARHAAIAYGNIEASFADKLIDEDEMEEMKTKTSKLITEFDRNCTCEFKKK